VRPLAAPRALSLAPARAGVGSVTLGTASALRLVSRRSRAVLRAAARAVVASAAGTSAPAPLSARLVTGRPDPF
jgi:hypothetical protein